MSNRLVTVARFAGSADAHRARQRLERAGILAEVSQPLASGFLSHVGITEARAVLQVRASELQKAGDILLGVADWEIPQELQGFWLCRDCQQVVDPGFELCWSCSQPREEVADSSFRPTLAVLSEDAEEDHPARSPTFELLQTDSSMPSGDRWERPSFRESAVGRSPSSEWSIVSVTNRDDLVTRAWRASVLGLFFFPPFLHVYSMYLLLRVSLRHGTLHPRSNRRFYMALAVNLLVGLASGVISSIRWAGGPW